VILVRGSERSCVGSGLGACHRAEGRAWAPHRRIIVSPDGRGKARGSGEGTIKKKAMVRLQNGEREFVRARRPAEVPAE